MRRFPKVTCLAVLFLSIMARAQKAPAPAAEPLAPITINPVHDGDQEVTGNAHIANVTLTIQVNDAAGQNSIITNATGDFTFALSAAAKAGNYVSVAGASNGKTLSGHTTVLDPPVKLGKPTLTANLGDQSVTVARNPADAAVQSLTFHLTGVSAQKPDCAADNSGQCQISLDNKLKAGDTVSVHEEAPAAAQPGPVATAAITAPVLAKVAISAAAEGDQSITVTADKGDLGKNGLRIHVVVLGDPAGAAQEAHDCIPDSSSGQCVVKAAALQPNHVVEANATADGDAAGPKVDLRVTPRTALGKPTIKPPQAGDKTVNVTVNSGDKQTGLFLRAQVCSPGKDAADCASTSGDAMSCQPDDATNSCDIDLSTLTKGQTIVAWERLGSSARNPADGVAASTVADKAQIGLPIIGSIKETDPSVKISFSAADVKKWGSNLTAYLALFRSGDQIANKTCSPAAGQDNCTITLDNPLAADDVLHVYLNAAPPSAGAGTTAYPEQPGAEVLVNVAELGFDWGRVRAYFSLGTVFSRYTTAPASGSTTPNVTSSNFSSPDVFAGLDMDFNWYSSQLCIAFPFGEEQVKLATLADAAAQCNRRGGGAARSGYHNGMKRILSPLTPSKSGSAKSQAPSSAPGTTAPAAATRSTGTNVSPTSSSSESTAPSSTQAAPPSPPAAMLCTDDPLLLADLQFLYMLDTSKQMIPVRLTEIRGRLDAAGNQCAAAKRSGAGVDAAQATAAAALEDLRNISLTPAEAREVLNQFGYESTPGRAWMINSYVLDRLTQTSASNGFALATSPNSVHMEGGIYLPVYFGWSRWTYKDAPQAFYMAPIAKLGFDSLRSSATDPILLQTPGSGTSPGAGNYKNAVAALSRDVYRMMAFGGRLGMFRLSKVPSRAPEQVMTLDFTYGRYDNFFIQKYGDTTGAVRFPWRFAMNSMLKIPQTPMFIGADLNKGVGPDDLRIYIAARTDLSALLTKLIPSIK